MRVIELKIGFVVYGGLTYGGAHRQAIRLATLAAKNGYQISYFWCRPCEIVGESSPFPQLDFNLLGELEKNNINCVEFKVKSVDLKHPMNSWRGTNLYELIRSNRTDIVISPGAGHNTAPWNLIRQPIILWNIFGDYYEQKNLLHVPQSHWIKSRLPVTPYVFNDILLPSVPEVTVEGTGLRRELNISSDTVLVGFHQRDDDNLYDECIFDVVDRLPESLRGRVVVLILGGSSRYQERMKDWEVKSFQLPVALNYERVSRFLRALDVYVHNGSSGETLGLVVQEAMFHSLPVFIKERDGLPNAHIELVGSLGIVSNNVSTLSGKLGELILDPTKRREIGESLRERADKIFSEEASLRRFELVLRNASSLPKMRLLRFCYNYIKSILPSYITVLCGSIIKMVRK